MKKFFYTAFGLTAAATVILSANAQNDKVEFKTTDLGNGIYMLVGQGGNIGFTVGDDGVFIIDDQFANLSAGILKEIRSVSKKPLRYVLNTHYHGDHTGGNENFAKEGATIIAHDNVRERMSKPREFSNGRTSPASPEAALPNITYSNDATVYINDQTVNAIHVPSAHTDGDTIVSFPKANIIHMGDTFFAKRYPFIDLSSGGSVDGFINALQTAADIANEETKIIPGHGPLSTKQDLLDTISALQGARNAVEALIAEGKTEEEIIAADPLAQWNETMSWNFIKGETMIKTIYADLTAE